MEHLLCPRHEDKCFTAYNPLTTLCLSSHHGVYPHITDGETELEGGRSLSRGGRTQSQACPRPKEWHLTGLLIWAEYDKEGIIISNTVIPRNEQTKELLQKEMPMES